MSWAKIKSSYDKNVERRFILWNNSNIKVNGNPIFIKDWYNRGIKYVDHLYDFRSKKFYGFTQVKQIYGLNDGDFLKYYSVISSIPSNYKQNMNQHLITGTQNHNLLDKISVHKKPSQILYKIEIGSKKLEHRSSEFKWKNLFEGKEIKWKQTYTGAFEITTDTKLRNFQYKFLMRLIPTNKYLYMCQLTSSNLCDFCTMYIESIEHLFWECPIVQNLWVNICNYLRSLGIEVSLNLFDICFGKQTNSNYESCVNFIILLCKYFVFKMKYMKVTPTFDIFKNYLIQRVKIEKEIAMQTNKMEKYLIKWHKFI